MGNFMHTSNASSSTLSALVKAQDGQGLFSRFILPMLPCVVNILMNLLYMSYGVYAVTYIDIPSQCEKTYHLKRFVTFSITFNSIGFFTYLVFSWLVKRNDRESARARAMALIVIHLAFSVWGSLTWQKLMNTNCEDDLDLDMKIAHEGSIAFNGVYFIALFLHEVIPHEADWTLMPVFIDASQKAMRPLGRHAAQRTQSQTTQRVLFKKVTPNEMDQHKLMDPETGVTEPSPGTVDRWGEEERNKWSDTFSAAHVAWKNQLVD